MPGVFPIYWFIVGQSGSIWSGRETKYLNSLDERLISVWSITPLSQSIFPPLLIPCLLIRWHFSKCMPVGWLLLIANLQVSELETLGNQWSIYLWTPLFKITDYLAANGSPVTWRRALLLVSSEGTTLQLLWGVYSPLYAYHVGRLSWMVFVKLLAFGQFLCCTCTMKHVIRVATKCLVACF
jgi:hypothetical protein